MTLNTLKDTTVIPVNYQYPLSAVIYKILNKADGEYAAFLHERGYGKGFKLFTFSQLQCPFRIDGDRFVIHGNQAVFEIAFQLPDTFENFIKGLFQTREIEIADNRSKGSFTISVVESLFNELSRFEENEIISVALNPVSPVVAGRHNERGNYDFLSPADKGFTESIIYNWREKIKSCFEEVDSMNVVLLAETILYKNPPRSRLITVKAATRQETKIRGWMNFELKATGERRFVELLLNAGAGLYNAQGMGCVERVRK